VCSFINVCHLPYLCCLVVVIILQDTQRVHPKELDAELPGDEDRIPNRSGESVDEFIGEK
jgi:hypothetical protein